MLSITRMAAAAAAFATVAFAGVAVAQNINGNPTYGNFQLSAGFMPDPQYADVVSGGRTDASHISGCRGFIATAPDVRVVYSAGNYPLSIWAESSGDTTLVINAPDGRWYCDDDSGGNLNPLVRFGRPQSGRYEIWVGTYGSATNLQARVWVSER